MKEKSKEKNLLLKGTLTVSAGNFIAKIIGAFYRIPLTNLLGGVGLGLYQTVFPVYCLLLDFSTSVPTALSRTLASLKGEEDKNEVFFASLKLLFFVGIIGSLFMLIFSKGLSYLQGEKEAYLGYIFLSPSVFFVGLISCFRGFFQGHMNMYPTALSQIIEQIIKLVFGILLVRLFLPFLSLAVGGATLAVTLSELFCLIFLFIYYKIKTKSKVYVKLDSKKEKSLIKTLFKITLPIMLIGITIPFSQIIDSFLIVNVLKTYRSDAISLYGLYSGSPSSIIHLPISICTGVSVAVVPLIARSTGESKIKNGIFGLLLTLILSFPCFLICLFFADKIVNFLFFRLDIQTKTTLILIVKALSPEIILHSLTHTTNSILVGINKSYRSLINMTVSIVVKTVVSIILLFNEKVNIYGAIIGVICSFLVATFLNLLYICVVKRKGERFSAGKNY